MKVPEKRPKPETEAKTKKPREVKIAKYKDRLWIQHGFHPHFQAKLKKAGGIYHEDGKKWSVSVEREREFDDLVQLYFAEANIEDHRKKTKPPVKQQKQAPPAQQQKQTSTIKQQKQAPPAKPKKQQKQAPKNQPTSKQESKIDRLRRLGHIESIRGNDKFVKYPGLLLLAHEDNISRTKLTLIHADYKEGAAVVHAQVTTDKGVFEGYGDCMKNNSSRNVSVHFIRVAGTRAKARALRDAVNIGLTCDLEIE